MNEIRIRAGAHTHWKRKNGEGIVVDFATGNYFVLDEVGAFYWQCLVDHAHSVGELVDATLAEYEAERTEVTKNAQNFYDYVLRENIAEPV